MFCEQIFTVLEALKIIICQYHGLLKLQQRFHNFVHQTTSPHGAHLNCSKRFTRDPGNGLLIQVADTHPAR